jgi:hypothetical protein
LPAHVLRLEESYFSLYTWIDEKARGQINEKRKEKRKRTHGGTASQKTEESQSRRHCFAHRHRNPHLVLRRVYDLRLDPVWKRSERRDSELGLVVHVEPLISMSFSSAFSFFSFLFQRFLSSVRVFR